MSMLGAGLSLGEQYCDSATHRETPVKWLLVMDKNRFHVYVVAVIESTQKMVRIDWHDSSHLTFRPYAYNDQEEAYEVGESRLPYCKECIRGQLNAGGYDLFNFNCRSVSYIILVMMGFKARYVFEYFKAANVLCGLDERQCLTETEIRRFIAYEKDHLDCTIL